MNGAQHVSQGRRFRSQRGKTGSAAVPRLQAVHTAQTPTHSDRFSPLCRVLSKDNPGKQTPDIKRHKKWEE